MQSFIVAFAVLCVGPAAMAADRPNILWITAEDLNPVLGCYGDAINAGHTPHIDELAERGVRFDRAYVNAPVCSSCRSGMILGAMQTTFGVHNHRSSRKRTPGEVIHLPEGITTLPQLLREAGYVTFNSGKDDYNFVYQREDLYTDANNPLRVARTKGQPFFGQIQSYGGKHAYGIEKKMKDRPRVDPASVAIPPYFPDIPQVRKQFAEHKEAGRVTDGDVGRVIKKLADDGLLENTVIFFMSDHGMPTSVRHKQFCYEGGVLVPLVVAGPGIPHGVVRDDLVSTLDVAATTVALAGLEIPEWFEGVDLFARDHQPREFVVSARDRCDYTIDRIRTIRTDRFRYIRNFMTDRPWMQPQYRDGRGVVREVRRMYEQGELNEVQARFYGPDRPAEELFDMQNDPHQINNLAHDPAHTHELKRHREILEKWIKDTDDKGQYPESQESLAGVLKRWGNKCVNPEYDALRAK